MDNNTALILITIIVLVIIWAIVVYNNIIRSINSAKETKSTIDVMLKNRFDLLPNLVSVVKKYMIYEVETLEKITLLRTGSNDISLDWQLSAALKNIIAVAENYPELKASQNFNTLQLQIEWIEDKLQAARRTYNASVKKLFDTTMMFPWNLIALQMNIPEFEMFEVSNEEKANPDVNKLLG